MDEITNLERLLDQLLDTLESVLQSGEILSDEFQGTIAQELNYLTTRIDELRSQPSGPIEPPISPNISMLWQLSGSNPEAFTNYLRTVPDPELNALLRNTPQLENTIGRLEREQPAGQPPSEGGIEHAPLQSSNIYGFQYDPKTRDLKVRFQSGSVYGYQGVPAWVFSLFRQGAVAASTNGRNQFGRWWVGKQPSLGASFYRLIRSGGYPYQQISGHRPAAALQTAS